MLCKEFEKLIPEYFDKELSKDVETEFLIHLESCVDCYKKIKVYETLDASIKETKEQLPKDFELKLPDKKHKVITLFRRHQGLVSAMVAVFALMIFAGGINNKSYEPSSVSEEDATQYEFSVGHSNNENVMLADAEMKNSRMVTGQGYNINDVLNYSMPPESEFNDKTEYDRLSELVAELKKKAVDAPDADEILVEFENILAQIESAKK